MSPKRKWPNLSKSKFVPDEKLLEVFYALSDSDLEAELSDNELPDIQES